MNIIFVSNSLGKARTFTLTQGHIILLASGILFGGFLLAFATYGLTLKFAASIQNPFVQSLVSTLQQEQSRAAEAQMKDNLSAMAKKVGELQARLARLDAFTDRLAKSAGVKREDLRLSETPGQGGPLLEPSRQISSSEFNSLLENLSRALDDRSDRLGILDSLVLESTLLRKTVPTTLPVSQGYYSSNFGYRIDPFTGRSAFHAGIDFIADVGTPVLSAAGGTVASAGWHGDYGNVIEIEHDNGLSSKYAHLSAIEVKTGDVVMKGQRIGAVGSTGRSTGPHLHFEVRENSVPLNPKKFLALGEDSGTSALVKR